MKTLFQLVEDFNKILAANIKRPIGTKQQNGKEVDCGPMDSKYNDIETSKTLVCLDSFSIQGKLYLYLKNHCDVDLYSLNIFACPSSFTNTFRLSFGKENYVYIGFKSKLVSFGREKKRCVVSIELENMFDLTINEIIEQFKHNTESKQAIKENLIGQSLQRDEEDFEKSLMGYTMHPENKLNEDDVLFLSEQALKGNKQALLHLLQLVDIVSGYKALEQ